MHRSQGPINPPLLLSLQGLDAQCLDFGLRCEPAKLKCLQRRRGNPHSYDSVTSFWVWPDDPSCRGTLLPNEDKPGVAVGFVVDSDLVGEERSGAILAFECSGDRPVSINLAP